MNKINWSKKLFFLVLFLFIFIFYFISIYADVFIFLIIAFIFLYLVILIITIYVYYPTIAKDRPFPKKTPTVAVVTYAYNNFLPVKRTVKKLLNLKYPIPYKVYVITDGTCNFLDDIKGVKQIIIDKKYFIRDKNVKSIIMNKGLKKIKEENIFCVDGDTIPKEDALMKLTGFLEEDKVVAVNGIILPENKNNFIEKIQVVEYNLNWGIYLRTLSAMNSINIPIGAMFLMKKKVFDQLGGYSIDNFVEDKELGYRIIKAGYKIRCAESARGYTETPDTFSKWFRQRTRWSRGELATLYEHRDVLFNFKYNVFGVFVLPFTFFVQTLGASLVFSYVFIYIRRTIIHFYFLIIEFFSQNIFVFPKFEILVLPSVIYVVLVSLIVFFIYVLLAFKLTGFNLTGRYVIPLFFFLIIYMYLIVFVYIVSMVKELFGAKKRW